MHPAHILADGGHDRIGQDRVAVVSLNNQGRANFGSAGIRKGVVEENDITSLNFHGLLS